MAERVALASPDLRDRADRPVAARQPAAEPVARMLDLQRSAGNVMARSVAGDLASPSPRVLARCGGGRCGCGGTCGGHDEELEEFRGAAALRRAVAGRALG